MSRGVAMREGTTQPAETEVSPDGEPSPERRGTSGHALFAPSNVQDSEHQRAATDNLTVTEFSNLVRFSSASIGCLVFPTPVPCRSTPESFIDLLYNTPSRCLQASTGLAHNHGLSSPDSLIGKPLAYLLPQDRGFKEALCEWQRRNFTREGFEWEVLDLQGHHTVLHIALYGHIEEDRLHKLWIITRDISALTRAIRNSGKAENHYREIINQSGAFFFRTHLDGTISFCTPTTQEELLFDPTHESPIEELLQRACHPDDKGALEQLSFHRRSQARQPLQTSLRLLSRRRGILHLILHQIPYIISGEVTSYDILGIEDGAPHNSSEYQLSQDTLVACLAHDVNNHLIVASANIELALQSLGEKHPAVESLQAALQAVSQSASINSQTLQLSSGIQTKPEPISLSDLFHEVVSQCDAIVPHGIVLVSSLASTKLIALADQTHARQILLNLIINARDALRESGIITLSATLKGAESGVANESRTSTVCISVSDNGPGIDDSVANTLFSPFVSTKSRRNTRGLGLAMVKTLVERNGGTISVTSAPGIGSTFTFSLPAAQPEEESSPKKLLPAQASTPPQPLSVLVADDEAEIRSTLTSALASRGHQAVAVPNLHSLIQELSRTSSIFHVVIIDDGMAEAPTGEILEITRTIHPNVAILITSGDPTASQHLPRHAHRCRFLAKPFALSDLYNSIESMSAATE